MSAKEGKRQPFPNFVEAIPEFIPFQASLPCDIYVQTMSTNRLFLFRRKGNPYDDKALAELKQVSASVYIPGVEWEKMLQSKGALLAELVYYGAHPSQIGEHAIHILRRLFYASDETAIEEVLTECSKVIQKTTSSFKSGGLQKTFTALQGKISYGSNVGLIDHVIQASSLCVLFAMAIGITDGKDLAELCVAGFLHDVGFIGMKESTVKTYFSGSRYGLTEDAEYVQHPEKSVQLAESKGIFVSPVVREAILEHHERIDGSGFPYQLYGEQISKFARILAITDEFLALLSSDKNSGKTPKQIFSEMIKKNSGVSERLDSKMLTKIYQAVSEQVSAAAA